VLLLLGCLVRKETGYVGAMILMFMDRWVSLSIGTVWYMDVHNPVFMDRRESVSAGVQVCTYM
jgi:hypothetical protein